MRCFFTGRADHAELKHQTDRHSVVLALRDSLNILLKNSVDKRTVIENYDLVVGIAVPRRCIS